MVILTIQITKLENTFTEIRHFALLKFSTEQCQEYQNRIYCANVLQDFGSSKVRMVSLTLEPYRMSMM